MIRYLKNINIFLMISVKCKSETTVNSKGLFVWNSTEYGNSIGIQCPNNKNTYATRLCLLMANGSAVWDNIIDSYCNEQVLKLFLFF